MKLKTKKQLKGVLKSFKGYLAKGEKLVIEGRKITEEKQKEPLFRI